MADHLFIRDRKSKRIVRKANPSAIIKVLQTSLSAIIKVLQTSLSAIINDNNSPANQAI